MKINQVDERTIELIFENPKYKSLSHTLRGISAKAFVTYCEEVDEELILKWMELYEKVNETDQTIRSNEVALFGKPLEGKESVINLAYFEIKENHKKYFEEQGLSLYSSISIMKEYIELVNSLWKEKAGDFQKRVNE